MDFFALGVLTHQLITGKLYNNGEEKDEIFQKILKSIPKFPSKITFLCKSFILDLMEKKAKNRLGSKNGI